MMSALARAAALRCRPPPGARAYKIAPQAKFTAEEQVALSNMSKTMSHKAKKEKVLTQMTYFVVGHAPDKAKLWDNSLLARIMVTPQKLRDAALDPAISNPDKSVAPLPPELAYGIGFEDREQKLLFRYLPEVSLSHAWAPKAARSGKKDAVHEQRLIEAAEMTKVEQLAKIIDLRNASAREIRAENTRRCIRAFSAPGQPLDSGRAEVQAAILTIRIRAMWQLMLERGFTPDTRRGLRKLCYDRKRMLKYLKRLDRDRYDILLGQLGVEQAAIEGELMV